MNVRSVQEDPAFFPFRNKAYQDLVSSQAFSQLMTKSLHGYERTMFIKLSMSLNKDMLIKGLLDEMLLEPLHAVQF